MSGNRPKPPNSTRASSPLFARRALIFIPSPVSWFNLTHRTIAHSAYTLNHPCRHPSPDFGLTPSKGAASTESIARVLGPKRRASILATLYMLRSDTSASVRQCTLQVWKTMVANTPKALREILGMLLDQIINALAAENVDKRTVAGRALGDVVKKLGERVSYGEGGTAVGYRWPPLTRHRSTHRSCPRWCRSFAKVSRRVTLRCGRACVWV